MKKLSVLVIVLSFGFAAPVFACPSEHGEAKTAKKSEKKDAEKKETAQKESADKAKSTDDAKKDKVSMK
jgi:hypothetical protein